MRFRRAGWVSAVPVPTVGEGRSKMFDIDTKYELYVDGELIETHLQERSVLLTAKRLAAGGKRIEVVKVHKHKRDLVWPTLSSNKPKKPRSPWPD